MNVLIVGAGGREHALAWKCSKSAKISSLFVTPGNGGIAKIAECLGITDIDEIVKLAVDNKIDLAIIGQEDYLVKGLTELLEVKGISVFGPGKFASQLEGSKVFAKEFMQKHKIPSASYEVFNDPKKASKHLKAQQPPYVIKASGLAAGKGVILVDDFEQAEKAIERIMVDKCFGEAGEQVVIEEFLKGEEASWFVITDGENFHCAPSLQDHKRQLDLDQGPNTGGMGCYSPAPVVTKAVQEKIIREIVEPTLEGMKKEGHPYKGVLYIGLMIDQQQPKVIEYNIRFGDPECQPLMMLLDSDLLEIALAATEKRLDKISIDWKQKSAVSLILASGGYPHSYQKGHVIQGLEEIIEGDDLMVFHAGTKKDQNRFMTSGGRVLGVTCLADDLPSAIEKVYETAKYVHWPQMQYRRDIGLKGLKRMSGSRSENLVTILMGSASDAPVAKKATQILKQFNISFKVYVSSAHRTPERTRNLIQQTEKDGCEVYIAIAGMAAHLPGVIASETQKPVIGIPVDSMLGGQDALYAIVQMPPGIPVATVGINRGENAALLATQILALKYPAIAAYHQEYRLQMEQKVITSQAGIVDA
ncbi:MAG: phosphoribosylamine--glycine ligase [Deltaproteobacteria bacterium]|nr:phosphoribosylamine--glycine ligase [Deltaproteobacteria bacterium]